MVYFLKCDGTLIACEFFSSSLSQVVVQSGLRLGFGLRFDLGFDLVLGFSIPRFILLSRVSVDPSSFCDSGLTPDVKKSPLILSRIQS